MLLGAGLLSNPAFLSLVQEQAQSKIPLASMHSFFYARHCAGPFSLSV